MASSMEPTAITPSCSTPKFSKFIRTLTKVLRFRTSQSKTRKLKFHQNDSSTSELVERERRRKAVEIAVWKLFAGVSTIKAAYAQLQLAQSPYNPDEIQSSDEVVIHELKLLSELKQSYLKKQLDVEDFPRDAILLAEVKEQKSVLKSYEVMKKKLEAQFKLKDSEILFLKEKLQESEQQNEFLEKEFDSVLDDLKLSELNVKHFVIVLEHCIESVRGFVKLFISNMKSAGWDLDAAAKLIEPGMVFENVNDRYFAFESFVCREMFEGFQYPKFWSSNGHVLEKNEEERQRRQHKQCRRFFDRFMEVKSTNAMEMLKLKPGCGFGKFCRVKYLGLVHPKMELSFFGDLDQRNVVNMGGYPDTVFFTAFVEMAKHIWMLHSLAFSFDPEVSIFQVKKGWRFSEAYMENVAEDIADERSYMDPRVGFTVIPGFKIGKTVLQCQVYLSSL